MTEPTDFITELTSEDFEGLDCDDLDALIQISKYYIRVTSKGFRWECQDLISASFPTVGQALKSLAHFAKLGGLTT
jgi:hypothetical protein